MMQARLNVNKLLACYDESVAKSADKDFADLKPLLAMFDAPIGSADMRRLFDEAEALVDTYRNAYVKASHDAQGIDVLVNGETMQMAEAHRRGRALDQSQRRRRRDRTIDRKPDRWHRTIRHVVGDL